MDNSTRRFPALKVHQWLDSWDEVQFSEESRRRKPGRHFYIFSMSAVRLRRMSAVYRRKAEKPRAEDIAIQRGHTPERSIEIKSYLEGGFPWSDLSKSKRAEPDFADLRMPGWLPTAIVANILAPGAIRGNKVMRGEDCLAVEELDSQRAEIVLPEHMESDQWNPNLRPIEIIDGQHRLLSFDATESQRGTYEVPVVAFYDLDVTWQAYLFYMINIKPKRINPSLAYDLYPILRVQDWLEKAPERASIYRDTRAQELTEVLWAHSESPWHRRINMLGSSGGDVTQAAFIRSLTASFVKARRSTGIGGLFGDPLKGESDVLQWTRTQQGAFLVLMWIKMAEAVATCSYPWAEDLREISKSEASSEAVRDPAFFGPYTLLATDQGVRGMLQIVNDLCYVAATELQLSAWTSVSELSNDAVRAKDVSEELRVLEKEIVASFLEDVCNILAEFDWRLASTPTLSEDQRLSQAVFRGSGGYKELRKQLLNLLKQADDKTIPAIATSVFDKLGY